MFMLINDYPNRCSWHLAHDEISVGYLDHLYPPSVPGWSVVEHGATVDGKCMRYTLFVVLLLRDRRRLEETPFALEDLCQHRFKRW